ncbi:hypothetical protein F5Y19DRAFT_480638 [Xylariaceae sp. FL1651]|nr:hypothetical protein F5Y19DRAFT_480638 [Xylariaceae sp. FL1651]
MSGLYDRTRLIHLSLEDPFNAIQYAEGMADQGTPYPGTNHSQHTCLLFEVIQNRSDVLHLPGEEEASLGKLDHALWRQLTYSQYDFDGVPHDKNDPTAESFMRASEVRAQQADLAARSQPGPMSNQPSSTRDQRGISYPIICQTTSGYHLQPRGLLSDRRVRLDDSIIPSTLEYPKPGPALTIGGVPFTVRDYHGNGRALIFPRQNLGNSHVSIYEQVPQAQQHQKL